MKTFLFVAMAVLFFNNTANSITPVPFLPTTNGYCFYELTESHGFSTDNTFYTADNETSDPLGENTFPILRIAMSYNVDTINSMVYFHAGATNGYDFMLDALYLAGFTSFQFATIAGTNEMAINALPPLGSSPVIIPLYTEVTLNGNYSILQTEFSTFPPGSQLILEDSLLSTTHDLLSGPYNYTGSPSDGVHRFKITIIPYAASTCTNPPFVSAGTDQTICNGDLATLSGIGGHKVEMNVTAPTASDYTFSGDVSGTDPNINVNIGDSVVFNVNAPGHPFWLKTVQGPGTANSIAVANNGTSSGTIIWIPTSAGTFYYNCELHAMMTGSITVSASTINYTWDNSVSDGVPFSPTATANYNVTATDNAGCTATDVVLVDVIDALSVNTLIISNYNGANISCNGAADGEAFVQEVFSGPPPPPFPPAPPLTYQWSDGQTASIASGLSAGTYTVTVTNVNGCSDISTVTLTDPDPLLITVDSAVDESCAASGGVYISISGGTVPYTFNWSNGQTSEDATGLTGGINYSVTVTDANGCVSTSSTFINSTSSTSSTDTQNACNSYTWIDGNTYTASNNTATFTLTNSAGCDSVITLNLTINNNTSNTTTESACDSYTWAVNGQTYTGSGTYTDVSTDSAGCTNTETLILTINSSTNINAAAISNYNGAEISCNGAADGQAIVVEVFNGPPPPPFPPQPPLTYLWSNGQNTDIASGLTAGTYTVTVTNADGCSSTDNVTISEPLVVNVTIDSTADASCTDPGFVAITPSGG
ncbi:MAG: hypothetical protein MK207_16090, partial [Saprospiraceae bacterium]|nr:hypothetical protein [Saprospiraceae bacterium]